MASTSALPQPRIQPAYIRETKSPKSMERGDNQVKEVNVLDYSKRAPWLRAAVLRANDGLLSTASLMMGTGAVRKGIRSMILTGIARVTGGACSVAIGEFVSVYSQRDNEKAQIKRDIKLRNCDDHDLEMRKKNLHCPLQAAGASALSFAVGATVPLLGAAAIKKYEVRLGVVIAAVSLASLIFGAFRAVRCTGL